MDIQRIINCHNIQYKYNHTPPSNSLKTKKKYILLNAEHIYTFTYQFDVT